MITNTVFFRQLQTERAFQKQPFINLNRKVKPGIAKKKSLRRHRDVGLGFKTPREVFYFYNGYDVTFGVGFINLNSL